MVEKEEELDENDQDEDSKGPIYEENDDVGSDENDVE